MLWITKWWTLSNEETKQYIYAKLCTWKTNTRQDNYKLGKTNTKKVWQSRLGKTIQGKVRQFWIVYHALNCPKRQFKRRYDNSREGMTICHKVRQTNCLLSHCTWQKDKVRLSWSHMKQTARQCRLSCCHQPISPRQFKWIVLHFSFLPWSKFSKTILNCLAELVLDDLNVIL